jgi:hypothetical protein
MPWTTFLIPIIYSFLYLFAPPHLPLMCELRSGHHRQRASGRISFHIYIAILAMSFRGIKRSADRFTTLPFEFLLLYIGSLRRRALTPSNFARRRGKSRSSAHLFHVPLTPAAYTLAVSPSHRSNSSGDESPNIYIRSIEMNNRNQPSFDGRADRASPHSPETASQRRSRLSGSSKH